MSLVSTISQLCRMHDELTRLRRENERLRTLVSQDVLTGVAVRHVFDARLAAETKRATRKDSEFSVLFLDIDHFKQVNDKLGHDAGDACLRRLGTLLRERSREYDTAARWGGEEFAVLMPNTGRHQAQAVAERLRATVEKDASGPTRITISIGTATWPRDARDAAGLVCAADAAMYRAKAAGRNRVETP